MGAGKISAALTIFAASLTFLPTGLIPQGIGVVGFVNVRSFTTRLCYILSAVLLYTTAGLKINNAGLITQGHIGIVVSVSVLLVIPQH